MIRPLDAIMTQRKNIPINDPGDIISEGITWITGGPSHIRLYMKGLYKDYDFWEVTFPKCRFGYMNEIDQNEYDMEIGRHKDLPFPLPRELADKAIAEMIRLEGTWYDVGEFLSQFFDEIGLDHTDQSNPEIFVCSSGVEHIMTAITFPYCAVDFVVSPQDIVESICYEKVQEGGE